MAFEQRSHWLTHIKVECGVCLVALVRDLPEIERLGLQPICTTRIEMRRAVTGDGSIYGRKPVKL